jgi:hypothetical protein
MPKNTHSVGHVPSVHANEHINGVLKYGFIYELTGYVSIPISVEGHYPETCFLPESSTRCFESIPFDSPLKPLPVPFTIGESWGTWHTEATITQCLYY